MRRFALLMLLAGCSTGTPPEGELAQTIRASAERNGVPRDLVVAIAGVEGGLLLPRVRILRLDDDVPVGGALELRHGAFNSLARGAALVGSDETALRIDTDLATEAGARVLAELGPRGDDRLENWRDAVEELSGYVDTRARRDYSRRVYQQLHDGATFPAREGELVELPAHRSIAVEESTGELQQAATDTPDFPGAIWFTTDCTNKCTAGRPDGNASVNTIVIHDTEGGWDASVSTLQNDSGKSVHYIVDADGSRVGQFRHETDTTWHAGNWEYNKHSVGIEHVGFVSNASGYARAEYDKSVALVKSIRTRWTVPLDRTHIVGHYQVPDGDHIAESSPPCSEPIDTCENSPNYGGASNHRDPGEHWDWCQYMESLGGSCDCADAWPLWNCTNDHTEAVRCTNGAVEIAHCDSACQSMPVGTDDVCPQASPAPSMDPTPDPSAPPSTPPVVDPSDPTPTTGGRGPNHVDVKIHRPSGGCAVGGAPADGALVWILLAISGAVRSARRRAARACAESRAARRSSAR
jgi:N-acetyl-anhydromuramyl-L-alanine amidase AmpD